MTHEPQKPATDYFTANLADGLPYRIRKTVLIVFFDAQGRVFIGLDAKRHVWDLPQGGINKGETIEQAFYREAREEVGLEAVALRVLGGLPHPYFFEFHDKGMNRKWAGKALAVVAALVPDVQAIDLNAGHDHEGQAFTRHGFDAIDALLAEGSLFHQAVPADRFGIYHDVLTSLRPVAAALANGSSGTGILPAIALNKMEFWQAAVPQCGGVVSGVVERT
ncbi:MAG: NUDIX domain-containing protein [Alphaproteobacteria bacterium]|nr:NUDIX domain-containing protein [Alphaproteobacteria bacterium]MBV8548805.1 NUDIX domain-containing protein [Alphaproteobacteria bacterium]